MAATSDDELSRSSPQGGRRGESIAVCATFAITYAPLIRERFPKIPRRVSGYNLDELLPENGFHVARALVGTEGTCVTVLEAKLKLIDSPQQRSLVGLRLSRRISSPPTMFPKFSSSTRSALKDSRAAWSMAFGKKGAPDLELMPEGGGFLLVEFGSNDPRETRTPRRGN